MPFTESSLNGAKFYYELAGEGLPVVLLHAGIADSRMWEDQFNALSKHCRVLRYDLRGYGQTTADGSSYTHHTDLKALLDQLGIDRAVLIGCSNGGRAAMNFALTFPERTAGLVMVCSSPEGFEFERAPSPLRDAINAAFDAGDLETTARLETQLWVVGARRKPEEVPAAIRDQVYEMNLIALTKEVAGVGDEGDIEPPAAERLDELHLPTLILIGELDSPVSFAAGNLMLGLIAGARTVVIPNTAHLPNMEQPDLFNQIVLDFIQNLVQK